MTSDEALERNLRLYSWHQVASQTLFWGPIFFFYFSAHFPVEQVLLLGSIYYVSVVALEVPSGYFSDRVSRALTLRISNAAMATAYGLFVVGDRFELFVAAQMTLALGYAFRSGTDSSFHFDTLAALGRAADFGVREAAIQRNAYLAIAASAAAGGALGVVDLRLPYAVQACVTVGALAISLGFAEPPREARGFAGVSFSGQLRACAGYVTRPFLAWLFAYTVLKTTTEHVPWEFAQPYVAAVFGESIVAVDRSPLVTGALHAVIAFLGAGAAAASIRIRDRIGVAGALLAVAALQTALIAAMAIFLHPVVVVLLVLRSVQPALANVVVRAAIVPRIPQAQRATYLSLHSLAGRLGFATVLFWLSRLGEPGAVADAETLSHILGACGWLAVGGLLLLVATARAVRDDQANSASRTG